ncbi:MAG: NAD(+) synthase [Victivallales bacterium]|nr:NAD(+) synthase [Victivallales bacterium]MCF7888855.1 NAD(+) synthase [Victivallales bacterium]
MYGFYKIASAVPKLKIADINYNLNNIVHCIKMADKKKAALISFPELCITSYTCGDLFFQESLISSALNALYKITKLTEGLNIISVLGLPVQYNNSLYNCAAVIQKGKILGIVPKSNLPNYNEFYEERWFTGHTELFKSSCIEISDTAVPFGTNLIFNYNKEFKFAVEICEDLWSIIPPSSYHTLAGATVIINISASNEVIGKAQYRTQLVKNQSAKGICGYIYTSSGVHESSSDLLYGGHMLSGENGSIIYNSSRFTVDNAISYSDIDCQKLLYLRLSESNMEKNFHTLKNNITDLTYDRIKITCINKIDEINRKYNPHPFVPPNKDEQEIRCSEIIKIQAHSLAKRLRHTSSAKSVIGISGGLDSTLALLVTIEAHKILNKPAFDIITVTMPGFGTTDKTYNNALEMCKLSNTDLREINIKSVCEAQFETLDIDPEIKNTVYENVQARQRTMLLMNIANRERGIVIGTGDLSEIALGWSTYNGDHMSMYAVNCTVPKTLIRYLINWYAENSAQNMKKVLVDIIDTPVTPELLPPDKEGLISQKTEDIIGPYELHDFFLYHTIKYGARPKKILYLANLTYGNKYNTDFIIKYLKLFIKRFFSQQFKRNCIPDGPKIGTIALSPRGDWRMPPDASSSEWIGDLNN